MPDIVIDYELLHRLGQQTDTLKHKISDARTGKHDYSVAEVGTEEVSYALGDYYDSWSSAFNHAWDVLESLSNTYTQVAQQWFDQDAGYASTANEQAAGFSRSIWEMKKSAYDGWKKLSQTYVPSHGYDENGNPYDIMVPLADPNKPPADPGAAPDGYHYTASDGSKHDTTSTYDSDGNLKSNDTTVTDGGGGFSYHEHTDFGANGSYTTVINHADGSKTTDTVVGSPDGSGTRTTVTVNSDGSTDTTTYTGTGLNTAQPDWTKNDS